MTAFTIVVAPVTVFIVPFIAAIIIATLVVIRVVSTSNVIFKLPISFFGVGVGVCDLEEFVDSLGPLAIEFGA